MRAYESATPSSKSHVTPVQIRALFAKLDTDASGFVEASDYRRVLNAWVTDQDIRDRILKLDTDFDCRIRFEEFSQHLESSSTAPIESSTEGFLRRDGTIDWFAVFMHFDTDDSGVMSLVELKNFIEEFDGGATRQELIRSMDENSNMHVSYSEFHRYFGGRLAPRRLHQAH